MQRKRRGSQGFTLIEILVVVMILAVLAATIIPQFASTTQSAKVKAARHDIATLESSVERFFLDMDRYPSAEEQLKALITPPGEGGKNWHGPYIKELTPDPWGNGYVYRIPGQHGAKTYDIWSRGPDGADGGDDVTSWHEEAQR
jgi:general secretion pathway protein G